MSKEPLSRQSILLINFCIVILDQLSKSWVRNNLNEGVSTTFIPGLLNLKIVSNTGAAFSILSGYPTFLGFLSLLVAVGLVNWMMTSSSMSSFQGLGIAFLLGGTIGNGLDRWMIGHVTDFLELIPINFPIFNGADIAINIGVILFMIDTLKKRRRSTRS